MLVESIIAFVLILTCASVIYAIGRRASPKPNQSESGRSMYACGEDVVFSGLRVNISLYRFLIYFVIFDSGVLLLAFAALASPGANPMLMILYLFMMLISSLLIFERGRD